MVFSVRHVYYVIDQRLLFLSSLLLVFTVSYLVNEMVTQTALLWPRSPHSNIKIQKIEQIVYSIRTHDDNDFIDVWADNVFTSQSYQWQKMPASYEIHLRRAFLRLELLCRAIKITNLQHGTKALINKHLVYLDKVLDNTWDLADESEKDNTLTRDWRSAPLDGWIVIECVVGQHDPNRVDKAINLNLDVAKLGAYMTMP